MSPSRRSLLMGAMVAVVSLRTAAIEPPKTTDPAPPAATDPGLLSGPTVDEKAANQTGGMMGEERRRAAAASQIPHRQWMNVLNSLELSEKQQDVVRVIMNEFTAAQRTFMAGLSEEDRALINPGRGQRAAAGDMPERTREQREKLAAIEQQRPKPEPYQQRIWHELSPAQQDTMKAELDAIRQRMAEAARQRRDAERSERPTASEEPMMTTAATTPMQDTSASASNSKPQRPRADRRGNDAQLDRMAQRRLRFLLSLTAEGAANDPRHIDGEPTDTDRDFRFDDAPTSPQIDQSDR